MFFWLFIERVKNKYLAVTTTSYFLVHRYARVFGICFRIALLCNGVHLTQRGVLAIKTLIVCNLRGFIGGSSTILSSSRLCRRSFKFSLDNFINNNNHLSLLSANLSRWVIEWPGDLGTASQLHYQRNHSWARVPRFRGRLSRLARSRSSTKNSERKFKCEIAIMAVEWVWSGQS